MFFLLIYGLFLFELQNLFLLGATAIEDKLQEVSFFFLFDVTFCWFPCRLILLVGEGVGEHNVVARAGKRG